MSVVSVSETSNPTPDIENTEGVQKAIFTLKRAFSFAHQASRTPFFVADFGNVP
jgi:hypothetical protein